MTSRDTLLPCFCTIVSGSHVPYALALARSLERQGMTAPLVVLVADAAQAGVKALDGLPPVRLITPRDLRRSPALEAIDRRFRANGHLDQYRWSLKPVLLAHLLDESGRGVVCADCDIAFFGRVDGLVAAMNGAAAVLTPHWRDLRLGARNTDLDAALVHGYFNAGFVAVTPRGRDFADWWARVCAYKCERLIERGLYDDQRYLDVVPHLFPDVRILAHRGYNLANWNLRVCERTAGRNGTVLINNQWPVVCVHFYRRTIWCIRSGRDPLLLPHLQQYEADVAWGREQAANRLELALAPVQGAPAVGRKALPPWRKGLRALGMLAERAGRRFYNWATPEGFEE